MIITRTPLRVSFAGGMSDIPIYYEKDYGCVVSAAINRYIYVSITHRFEDFYRIKYSQTENVDTIAEIQHPLVRECLKLVKISEPVEITITGDVPSRTGLGSSSTFTVGLLHALHRYKNEHVDKFQLAEEASHIEIDVLKSPIGKQDQYAASFGGCNQITFTKDVTKVRPLSFPQDVGNRLHLFYLGRRQSQGSNKVHMLLQEDIDKYRPVIDSIRELANTTVRDIDTHLIDVTMGQLLEDSWQLKKHIEHVSTPEIDALYTKLIEAGASGGKLLGAGGSGFLMMYMNPNVDVNKLNIKEIPFSIDLQGSIALYEE